MKCVQCWKERDPEEVKMVRCALGDGHVCAFCCIKCSRYSHCEAVHSPERLEFMRKRAETYAAMLNSQETKD